MEVEVGTRDASRDALVLGHPVPIVDVKASRQQFSCESTVVVGREGGRRRVAVRQAQMLAQICV